MRRLISITAFALFLAVPLWAQHGGGHGGFGGGHAGGFSGGHFGGFGGARMSGGGFSHGTNRGLSQGLAHAPVISRNFSRGPFLHDGFRNNGFGNRLHERFRNFGFSNNFRNCIGIPCRNSGYPWGWGYYDPWLWDWSYDDSRFDNDYNQDLATAAEMNRENLEEQRMLRQEQEDGDQDAYADRYRGPLRSYNSESSGSPQAQSKPTPMYADTVLVFRDKHQQEVENYAIVGDKLWNFAPGRTQKIALDDLDLAATKKANEDRGTTFRLPGS